MLSFQPDKDEFDRLAMGASTVPVYCTLLSDQLTPVSAFDSLAGSAEHAFLLESVVGGEKIARYSFLAIDPIAIVEAKGSTTLVSERGQIQTLENVDPLSELEKLLAKYRVVHPPELPRFIGGAVGYAGYDIVRHYEKLGEAPPDQRDLPDLQFGIYDQMVVFDHVRKLILVVAMAHVSDEKNKRAAYVEACERLSCLVEKLGESQVGDLRPLAPRADSSEVPFQSTFSSEQFMQAVDQCKDYIRAGDIFQVVISQRLTAETKASPFDVYRALRVINPSPFMFLLQSPRVTLVGASPEILCRVEGRSATTRPLAGTRPRGNTEAEDLGLEAELLADPKERAEHIMLVDLGRNDLGRICEPGSVEVDDLMSVERYSHVMHICSNVTGKLARDKTSFDALRSILPVGTVSGAPKIRAMQIIDELEPVRRGPYAGTVGYIDFAGNMDTCITLRTLVITPAGDGSYLVDAQVGAGIVADSEPAREYQETLNKAQSMLSALQLANAWADQAGNNPKN